MARKTRTPPKAEPDRRPGRKPEPQPEPEPEPKPEPEPEPKPDPKPAPKPGPKPQSGAERVSSKGPTPITPGTPPAGSKPPKAGSKADIKAKLDATASENAALQAELERARAERAKATAAAIVDSIAVICQRSLPPPLTAAEREALVGAWAPVIQMYEAALMESPWAAAIATSLAVFGPRLMDKAAKAKRAREGQ